MHSYLIIPPILSAILCAGLGLFTLSRNPRHPANIGFTLGMLSLALIGAGNAITLYPREVTEAASLGIRLSLIGTALLPATWLLFTIVFARGNYGEILKRWAPVLAASFVISIFFALMSGRVVSVATPGFYIIESIGRYFYIYLVLGLVVNLIQLENTLRSSSGESRRKAKYVIFGVGGILAFFIYMASQSLLFGSLNVQILPVVSAVVLISTSVMTLSIVKHRLMGMDIFISRYVVYNSLSLLLVGVYLLSVGIITHAIRYFDIPFNYFFTTLFIFISMLVLAMLLFSSRLRRKAQLFITRHFYRQKYEFREKWLEATERVSLKMTVKEISKTLREMISETIAPKGLHLWLYNPVSGEYNGDEGVPEEFRSIPQTHPLIKHAKALGAPFMIDEIDGEAQAVEIEAVATATKSVLCAPMAAGPIIVGFVLLDKDLSGEPYTEDDFGFLKALTTQAAVRIRNITLSEDLMNAREVEAFHRMSSFVMHDLKNLTNALSLVSQNAQENIDNPEFQKDAIRSIDSTVERMKGLIGRLSELPGGLDLHKSPVQVKSIVKSALEKLPLSGAKNVTVVNEVDASHRIDVDPEAMDMVFLNLLKNAYEAVGGEGIITIRAVPNDGKLEVTITDNGVGMAQEYMQSSLFKPFKTTKKGGFGIGLFQCKAIIDAHGGRVEVQSTEGDGTTFKLTLPGMAGYKA